MLTGQLYYYLKKLDEIRLPLTADQASNLDILGLPYISATAFAELDDDMVASEVKNLFVSSYGNFMKENGLAKASQFWNLLTSPIKLENTTITFKPQSEFQESLMQWSTKEFEFSDLEGIIKQGEMVFREDDLALVYGLKCLYIFSDHDYNDEESELTLSVGHAVDSKKTTYSTKPQILVLTTEELAPLFINISCEAIPLLNDDDKNIKEVKEIIQSRQSIRLILVEGAQTEELIKKLRKSISQDILVSGIEIPKKQSESGGKTYFDMIARSTLGVRLD
jgi:vacuolar-type H+-ATPase subunit F/Vma7